MGSAHNRSPSQTANTRKVLMGMAHRHQRTVVFALGLFLCAVLGTEYARGGSYNPAGALFEGSVGNGGHTQKHVRFPSAGNERICSSCDCSAVGSYLLSPEFGALPTPEFLNSPQATHSDLARYLSHHIFVQSQNTPMSLLDSSRVSMYQNFASCPDKLLSLSFEGLRSHVPTAYAFTRTGSGGRLGAPEKRLRYFKRHADTIRQYYDLVEKEGYADGVPATNRQFLWIVLEDDDHIEPEVAAWLLASKIPHIYIAHGPTRYYGLSQWNLAYQVAVVLRNSLLGDGPLVSVDDDAMIKPELLRRIWRVKKVIAWQVGNFPKVEPSNSTWEGPFVQQGKLIRWHNAWAWGPHRTFPLDMGGFAVNSAVLGPGRLLEGPRYIPEKPQNLPIADGIDTSNESEFLKQFYDSQEEMEVACWDNVEEKCYWAWHNHWMPEDYDGGHPPPLGADF